jgi:uncharacterized 2Fe-2S/4Fe-4S cluster protein (DUF4445 family)
MTVHIDFEPVGRRGDCPERASLLDCARQLGVDLVNICGGSGSCGRCIVQIVTGDVSPPTDGEETFLSEAELTDGYRLACRTIPRSDCTVRVPPESLTTPQRTQVEGEEVPVTPDPAVRSYPVTLSPPSLEDLRADSARLLAALGQQHEITAAPPDLAALQTLSPTLRAADWHVRCAVRDGEVIALLPSEARPLGLAVDLGTTKIAAYLLDLESGVTLAARGVMNPQIAYGEDLVSRMVFAKQSLDQAAHLQQLVVDALNGAVTEMVDEVEAASSHVVEAVVVGNTAMHHLFLGLDVDQLARAPYVATVDAALDVRARDLGLAIAPGGRVHLLPNIAGYVGADHVAMLLATGVAQAEGVVLAIDIGTNTEICLANRGHMTSVSCASGPAFEGAHIQHGMRAAAGAIERLRLIDNRIDYQTIGGVPPVGLCGSGILDALAQLYTAGVVDRSGRMGDAHPRVREIDGLREFVLVSQSERGDGRPAITFTQKDVRELQLAKGAMRTGIDALLEAEELAAEAIDQVIIAGAFGTYIDVASAIEIGMLPRLPLDRFRQVGNAAGMGAKLALVSRSKRAESQAIARQVDYIELASLPDFAMAFAESMYLG